MRDLLIFLQRNGPGLLNTALLVMACVLAAKWTWVFLAPLPVAPQAYPQATLTHNLTPILTAHLFGQPDASTAPASDWKLVGVFAAPDERQGYAMVQSHGMTFTVIAQGKLDANTTLISVAKDHVELEQSDVRKRLELEKIAPDVSLISN